MSVATDNLVGFYVCSTASPGEGSGELGISYCTSRLMVANQPIATHTTTR